MRKGLLPLALGLSLAASMAAADVLVVPEGEPVPQIKLPAKGTSMAEVLRNYGEPRNRRPTVGGDSPEQPPITRWDYDGFSVIFERDKVVDGVVPGAPPPIVNRAGLERVPEDFVPFTERPVEPPAVPQERPVEPAAAIEQPFNDAPMFDPAAERPAGEAPATEMPPAEAPLRETPAETPPDDSAVEATDTSA